MSAEFAPSLVVQLSRPQKPRIAGLGVAAPFQLWNWESEIGAPPGAMNAWRDFDAESEIAAVCPYPTTLCNDATAACAAEFFFGGCWRYRDFLYFFIGEFLGGGLVLDGALASWDARATRRRSDRCRSWGRAMAACAPQLIACASIYQLERRLEAAGIDASSIWATPEAWGEFGPQLDGWIEEAASALAYATVAAISVIDFEAIVIDGAMPATVRERLDRPHGAGLRRPRSARLERRRHSSPGSIGADARSIGGAALPLIKHFARDREVLFKECDEPGELSAKAARRANLARSVFDR